MVTEGFKSGSRCSRFAREYLPNPWPESMMGTSIDRLFEAVIKNYKRFSAIEELLSPSFGRNVYDGHFALNIDAHTIPRDMMLRMT